MRRRYLLSLVALGVVLFVAISIGLARVFGANGAEQSAITSLVKAEAAGDQQASPAADEREGDLNRRARARAADSLLHPALPHRFRPQAAGRS